MPYRRERDTMGQTRVPVEAYYGVQTARSMQGFAVGDDTMPFDVIAAWGILARLTDFKP